jgi:glycosyltransferase involved in cell wall biosynthesis
VRRRLRIVHAIRSDNFAGVERYVCEVANALGAAGHEVVVVGGDPERMRTELATDIVQVAAPGTIDVWRGLSSLPDVDLIHAHMTAAEVAVAALGVRRRVPVVATRHFPGRRGAGAGLGLVLGPAIRRRLAAEVAVSRFVADRIRESAVVIHNGVSNREPALLQTPRVLMMSRLDPEKHVDAGIRAWAQSRLADRDWTMEIAGAGTLASSLRRLCVDLGVQDSVKLLGRVDGTDELLAASSVFLAPAPAEPFGLAVVEAMARGLPVVAAAGGGHLETVGAEGLLFDVDDVEAAGAHLRRLADDHELRTRVGQRLRERQQRLFSLERHVARLEQLYLAVAGRQYRRVGSGSSSGGVTHIRVEPRDASAR